MKFRLFDSQALIGQSPDNDVVLARPWTVDRLIEDLDRFEIDLAVVSHRLSYDWCPYQGNLELARQLKAQPRLYPCFVILPSHTDEQPPVDDYLDQMRTANVAMVRLCPTHFRFSAAPTVLKDWYSRLERYRIPVFFDYGESWWMEVRTDYEQIDQIAERFPALPIILYRQAFAADRFLFPLLKHRPNIYLETSGFVGHRKIELYVKTFGPERLIFGTGLPHKCPSAAIGEIAWSGLDENICDLIGYGNLESLVARINFDA